MGYGSYAHRRQRTAATSSRPARFALHLFEGSEWARLALGFLTFGIAVYSVQQADWTGSKPPLVLLLGLSLLSSAIMFKLQLPRFVRPSIALILGALAVLWQGSKAAGDQGLTAALGAPLNEGTIYFALFVVAATWLCGFICAWSLIKRKNPWVPAGIGGGILLINLSNLPPEHMRLLPVYFGSALLLIGINALLDQRAWLRLNRGKAILGASKHQITAIIGIGVAAILASSIIPTAQVNQSGFDAGGQFMSTMQNEWFNIFASVPGKWTIIQSQNLKTLLFSSPIDNRDTVLFVVTANQGAYWRVNRYDSYSSWGWTSTVPAEQDQKPVTESTPPAERSTVRATYTVENRSKTDVILLAGEYVSSSVPVRLENYSAAGSSSAETDILAVTSPEMLPPYQRYTQVVSVSSASPAQLSSAGTAYAAWVKSRYLELPTIFSPRIRRARDDAIQDFSKPL